MDWFFRDSSGRLALVQLPNPALWVWLTATALRWSQYDERDTELRWIGTGALIVWALDELVRGASPFRRLLGAVVLVWQLAHVF
ncbi:hypothetical protein ASE12_12320 [Aeromicrobium sp. Root236]|uniref:hypothetical protein n=1 Tax=Aeromicrobium sp. Root236 TaxID=1736498 RepID=UPI000700DB61|nr:hypothetical protein [Aeromicrobium sp. Root236]KRC65468.1 hypothetical protein ASE12_12320 [Aeromicrobium sp. Root236]